MRRREFIALTGGAATVWPLAARAQQRMRGWHAAHTKRPQDEALGVAFIDGLHKLGWSPGSNGDRPSIGRRRPERTPVCSRLVTCSPM
jgi:putative ABC transport system substrate-binding protein